MGRSGLNIFLILVIFSLFLPRYTYRILQTRCHKALRDVFLGVALEDYLGYMHTILQVTNSKICQNQVIGEMDSLCYEML